MAVVDNVAMFYYVVYYVVKPYHLLSSIATGLLRRVGVNLGATLRPLRERRGLTQAQLAAKAQLLRTDVNALERGRVDAGPDRLRRLAAALDVSVIDLGAGAAEAPDEWEHLELRLAGLATDLAESMEEQARLNRKIQTLQARVRKLEARAEPPATEATGQ